MSFYDSMERFGHTIAFITEDGEEISYEMASSIADQFGVNLSENALVFILSENSLESVIGYLGCLRSRAKAALISGSMHPDLLKRLLDSYKPHYIWLPSDRTFQIPNAKELFSFGRYVLVAVNTRAIALHPDLALLMTTSGSTGSPKFVRQSYTNICSNTAAIAEYLKIVNEDRAITSLPMHYVYGLSVINSHLHSGASIVLSNSGLTEKTFWQLLKSTNATTFSGVPYTYELLKRLQFSKMDLPRLKTLTQAGGKLSPTLVCEFADTCRSKDIDFYVMYGAAEATARMSYLPPEFASQHPSSIGVAIPGGQFLLENDEGKIVTETETTGELLYRGANVTMGYATCCDDLNKGDERFGLLRTGDIAQRDARGLYYIVGRKSRFLKLFGNRVNLEDVEQLIRQSGVDCACTGDDSSLRIYITDSSQKDRISSMVHELTKLHCSVFKTLIIDKIPRNDSGKICYLDLP